MAKRLTARQVATMDRPGMHPDGQNLYLQVTVGRDGKINRSWIFRYRRRDMGLGSASAIPLPDARALALEARLQLVRGIDPIEARRQARQGQVAPPADQPAPEPAPQAKARTFEDEMNGYAASRKWSPKQRHDWLAALTNHAAALMSMEAPAITTNDVLGVLEPLWQAQPVTAQRLRRGIEKVLARALVDTGKPNVARWAGHLEHRLDGKAGKAVKNHDAMPYADLPAFFARLQAQEGMTYRALQLIILSAVRVSEALDAKWGEFDLPNKVWVIPAERMKAGKELRVPLSAPAMALLEERAYENKVSGLSPASIMPWGPASEYVFPAKRVASIADALVLRHLKKLAGEKVTTHGFRSAFKDWATEQTDFPNEVSEMALAHQVGSAVERAYKRTDLFEKRRLLMDAWATYLTTPVAGSVVPLKVVA